MFEHGMNSFDFLKWLLKDDEAIAALLILVVTIGWAVHLARRGDK